MWIPCVTGWRPQPRVSTLRLGALACRVSGFCRGEALAGHAFPSDQRGGIALSLNKKIPGTISRTMRHTVR
jgi:hypothetical protein